MTRRIPAFLITIVLLKAGFACGQETTLHAQSNVVLVPTMVMDSQGEPICGLTQKDFFIQDDGVALPVRLDEAADSEPISLVVALQVGRKAKHEFPRMKGLRSLLEPV